MQIIYLAVSVEINPRVVKSNGRLQGEKSAGYRAATKLCYLLFYGNFYITKNNYILASLKVSVQHGAEIGRQFIIRVWCCGERKRRAFRGWNSTVACFCCSNNVGATMICVCWMNCPKSKQAQQALITAVVSVSHLRYIVLGSPSAYYLRWCN